MRGGYKENSEPASMNSSEDATHVSWHTTNLDSDWLKT